MNFDSTCFAWPSNCCTEPSQIKTPAGRTARQLGAKSWASRPAFLMGFGCDWDIPLPRVLEVLLEVSFRRALTTNRSFHLMKVLVGLDGPKEGFKQRHVPGTGCTVYRSIDAVGLVKKKTRTDRRNSSQ